MSNLVRILMVPCAIFVTVFHLYFMYSVSLIIKIINYEHKRIILNSENFHHFRACNYNNVTMNQHPIWIVREIDTMPRV